MPDHLEVAVLRLDTELPLPAYAHPGDAGADLLTTVDAGYRGEIKVLLVNHDISETVRLQRGDRIAQLVVQRVEQARFVVADALPETSRGAGGHGSTGGLANHAGGRVDRAGGPASHAGGRVDRAGGPANDGGAR